MLARERILCPLLERSRQWTFSISAGMISPADTKAPLHVSAMVILAAAFLQRQVRRTPSAQIRVACSTKAPSSRIGDRPHLVEHGNAMTTARIAPHATRRNMGRSGAVQLLTGSACNT